MTRYSAEPSDPRAFTAGFDRMYTRVATLFDWTVKLVPTWRRWLRRALPHVEGPRVLEVSFGTGYLLTQLPAGLESHGLDYNAALIETARRNLRRLQLEARLVRGTVEALPYADGCFNTVLTTMAFSGYPDGAKAMGELSRVLKDDGRLVIVDVGYPEDGSWLGTRATRLWQLVGDIIRDLPALLAASGFEFTREEIGGFGSVHLYVARKRSGPSDG
jgi:ubiquinone/menaquinone biosynthesis C-methylase UbiE